MQGLLDLEYDWALPYPTADVITRPNVVLMRRLAMCRFSGSLLLVEASAISRDTIIRHFHCFSHLMKMAVPQDAAFRSEISGARFSTAASAFSNLGGTTIKSIVSSEDEHS